MLVSCAVDTPKRRPAESTGIAGAAALLAARLLGVSDPDVIVALAVVLGALPAGVTAVVVWTRRRGA